MTDKEIELIREECSFLTKEELTEYVIRQMIIIEAYKNLLKLRKDEQK